MQKSAARLSAEKKRRIEDHPSVIAVRAREASRPLQALTLEAVRALALEAGAEDAGVVSMDHPDLAEDRAYVLRAFPKARSLVVIVLRMHAEDVRSPARSVANLEFHRTGHEVDEVARRIAVALTEKGIRASTRRWRSRWRWTSSQDAPGSSRTNASPSPPSSVAWAFTAT